MTEKRFTTVKKDDGLFYVANDKFGVVLVSKEESLMVMSMCNDMIESLNKLYDENEQLKQQNKMLRTNVGKLTDDIKYLRNLPSTHQKENEQLKSELKSLRKKYNDFSDAVDKRLKELRK